MQFIVNLTSYSERLLTTGPLAIRSLLNQTEQADRLILWLAHGTNVPQSVADLINAGLEIRYCDDYRSYKKLIPALEQFPNDVLITVDDDFYYPMDLLANLKASHLRYPERIHVNRAHEIVIEEDGELRSYKDWNFCVSDFKKEGRIFPTGCGGILYPPKSLHSDVLDVTSFMSLAPKGDDIWFWAMARLQGTKYYVLENGHRGLIDIDPSYTGMWIENVYQRGNDIQLLAVLEKYPELLEFLEKSM